MDKTVGDAPIRVCFVVLKAYPLFNPDVKATFGGAEVDSYLLATELAKDSDFEVSFVTADYGQQLVEVHEGVTVIKSLKFDNLILGPWKLFCALRKADTAIYFRKMPSVVTTLVALFCRFYRRAFVYRTATTGECDGTYIKRRKFAGRAFAWSLRNAEAVFTQNTAASDALLANTGVSSIAIGNAHRLPAPAEARRDTILWVGRSDPEKRPDLFLKLACELPEENLTIVCPKTLGDERYDELVEQAGQIKNLEFIEYVPFGRIEGYFKRAKVLANTSDAEGFPNTFIQAGAAGAAILSLNANPGGYLTKYNCGASCNGDWQTFVDRLKSMLAEDRYAEPGKNGRRYVEENHDVTKIIERYRKTFKKIAAGDKI